MRGGQVVSLDLVDLGMVQKQGTNYVPSPAMQYIMRQSGPELKVRPGAIRTPKGMKAMLTYISRLTENGVGGLFVVPDYVKVIDSELRKEISPARVGLKGKARGDINIKESNGLAFRELAYTFGLQPMLSTNSKTVLEKIKSLIDEELVFKKTPDYVDRKMNAERDKSRQYVVAYYAKTGEPVKFADLTEKLLDLTPKQRTELAFDPVRLRVTGAIADAFDFRETAIGRIFNNASTDVDSLRAVVDLASNQLGQGKNSRVAGRATALNSVAEAAMLRRMQSNPNSAVKTSLTGLTWEARLAYIEYLKEGSLSPYIMENKHLMNQWESAGLVNMKDGVPELTPLGVLSTLYTLEYSTHWHQTLFTRAMLTDLPKFGGAANKFYEYTSLMPKQYAHLAELFTSSVSDVQSGLALDLARHINILGDDSAYGVSNMLTHYSRVYRGTFDKYFHNSDPLDRSDAVATHKAENIGRTYREINDAQINQTIDGQRKVAAVVDPYEAAFFSRVEIQQKLHREQQFQILAREGSLIVGRKQLDGTWAPPRGQENLYVQVRVKDLQPGAKAVDELPEALEPEVPDGVEVRINAIIEDQKLKDITPEVKEKWLKDSQALVDAAEKSTLYAERGPKRDLAFLFGDLAEAANQGSLFMKRPQAGIMGLEDRVAKAWAETVLAESSAGRWSSRFANPTAVLVKLLEKGTNVADYVRENPITRQFKVRKLMLSALGPQTRNVQANSMLTALITPGAFSSKSWWDGFSLYWKSYRNGKAVDGFDQDFLNEITSLKLVQSGITAEFGFDYTQQNVAIDAWLSGLKQEMDDFTAKLDKGLSASDVAGAQAVEATRNIALSHRRMSRTGMLDNGALIGAAEALPSSKLASQPRAHTSRKIVEYTERGVGEAGSIVGDARKAFAPLPLEGVSPENRFLRFGKKSFNDTDESFKMALAYYLYKEKGLRGEALRAEIFKLWPDYQNINDAEKMYTIYSVFGVYQTKYYRIMTQFMLEHPLRLRAAILMDQYSKASELSDPETMEAWRNLPRHRKAFTSRTGLGWQDESGYSVLSSDRFEMDGWQNPIFDAVMGLMGMGRVTPEGIPRGATAGAWWGNMLDVITQTTYGSTQINPLEVGYNFWANDADIGDFEEYAEQRNQDPISFWRKLARATVAGSGPRSAMLLGSLFGEPSRLGQAKPPESLLNAMLFNLTGVRFMQPDDDEEARVARAKAREAREIVRGAGGLDFAQKIATVKQDTGRLAAPSLGQRVERQALNNRQRKLINGMFELDQRGMLRDAQVLRKAQRLFMNEMTRGGNITLPQRFLGPDGERRLWQEMIDIEYKRRQRELKSRENN